MLWTNLIRASALLCATAAAQTTRACNNSPSLCNRAYNNITHLGAHDSPFLRDKSTSFSTSGNQFFDSTTQLDAGVRLLSAQVHKKNGTSGRDQWHLCHSSCDLLDAGTLSGWLKEVKTWMDGNPNDVVTLLLVNSDDATPAELGAQFTATGIDKYAYSPPTPGTIPQTWPTLQSLISNNTRLLTFVASLSAPSAEFPYLMDEFTFIFENDFENETPTDYSCDPDRPTALTSPSQATSSNRMFLQNHFLYSTALFGIQSPNVTYVSTTNAEVGLGSLGTAINKCAEVYKKAATFVLVDFFNVGPAIASVDAANRVTDPVGRKSVTQEQPDEEAGSDTSGASRREQSLAAIVVTVVAAVVFSL